jgi:hyperosmotically inducible periplasmic protein
MITRICSVILAVLFLASICLADNKPVSDDVIVDEVRIKLSGDAEVKGGALKVDCKQGVVTLAGAVDTEAARGKAAKLAKRVKGVKDVVNNLTVKEK